MYFRGFFYALFGRTWWWVSLIAAYVLGVGIFSSDEYPLIRSEINRSLGIEVLPEHVPLWLIIAPLLFWIIVRLAHREAMAWSGAARIDFEEPFIDVFVPLFANHQVLIGDNDIAKIAIRNVPYDGARGKEITNCYASISFLDARTRRSVLQFDYPRWEENPKPGYHTNPRDHYPDEWNRRDLLPSGERSTLNFLVKTRDEAVAYGFRGRSQLVSGWHDRELELKPGTYLVKLTVSGVGLRKPAEQWLTVDVGGANGPLRVEKTRAPERMWFQATSSR